MNHDYIDSLGCIPNEPKITEGDWEEEVEVSNMEEGDVSEILGATNIAEVKHHIQSLDKIIQTLGNWANKGLEEDIVRDAIEGFKEVIAKVAPAIMKAKTEAVVKAIRDPQCLALHPQTEEIVRWVGRSNAHWRCPQWQQNNQYNWWNWNPHWINKGTWLGSCLNDPETAHNHMAWACSMYWACAITFVWAQDNYYWYWSQVSDHWYR